MEQRVATRAGEAVRKARTAPRIDLARRAEIAAERRRKTRAAILVAAFRLIGEERGDFQRVEDFCTAAGMARGTFYNYFNSIEQLYEMLADELSRDFDVAVHRVMETLPTATARTAAAIRYYLRAAMDNPRWGWAMVHTSMGREVFGPDVSARAKATIQDGIAANEFTIDNAELGKALLLGAGLAGILDIVRGRARRNYPEQMARQILMGLGLSSSAADTVITERLPALQPVVQGDSAINFWANRG
jgi:AcrR family transcriptional regulator